MKKLLSAIFALALAFCFATTALAADDTHEFVTSINQLDKSDKVVAQNISTYYADQGGLELKLHNNTFSTTVYMVKDGKDYEEAVATAKAGEGKATFTVPATVDEGTYKFCYVTTSAKYNSIGFPTLVTRTSHWSSKTLEVKRKQPVANAKVSSVKIGKPASPYIKAGAKLGLRAIVLPGNAKNPAVSWKSSSNKLATVSSSGVVKGIRSGMVTITATSKENSTKRSSITLYIYKQVTSLKSASKGQVYKLYPTVKGATGKRTYSSSKSAVVAVTRSDGFLTAKAKGSATITCKVEVRSGDMLQNKTFTYKLTVK